MNRRLSPTAPLSHSERPATDVPPEPTHRDRPATVAVIINAPCSFCGYNLRGLQHDSICPECGVPVTQSVSQSTAEQRSRVRRRWALLVLIGLLGMLLLCPSQIWVALEMRFGDAAFGSATRLNVPGPKVWATTLVQRSLGYRPEWLGVQGTWVTLLGLVAVFLVTSPRVDTAPRTDRLRVIARWLPAILTGGFFGFLMNAEYLYHTDVAVGKYALIGIVGVELPCSLMLMIYLAALASDLGQASIARLFQRVAVAMAVCMIGGIAMGMLAKDLEAYRNGLFVQIWSALYGAACILTALLTLGAFIRLITELFMIWIPKRLHELLRG